MSDRERKTLLYSRMPTNTCRMSDGNRYSPFGSHHGCGWMGLESSKDAKAGGWRFDEEQDIGVVLECLPTTDLSKTKEKMVSSWCRNLTGTNLTWSPGLASLFVGCVGNTCPDVLP